VVQRCLCAPQGGSDLCHLFRHRTGNRKNLDIA
jgi:hypothetical protein